MDLTPHELIEQMSSTFPHPIWIRGFETRFGAPMPMHTVSAPAGVRSFQSEEMLVACGAGTGVDELAAVLGERGQYVNLPRRITGSGTVGGALSLGEGDVHRLGRGSVRDALLQATFVTSSGDHVKAGGPTVKNVSGFDLCKAIVGSCGRLGFMAEVILRTRPLPLDLRWFVLEEADWSAAALVAVESYRPSSILWTGTRVHLCLEGHPADIDDQVRALSAVTGRSLQESPPPELDGYPHRWVIPPGSVEAVVSDWLGSCIAEVGTGVVHHREPREFEEIDDAVSSIEHRLLQSFDPEDRMNGGTKIWGSGHRRKFVAW